MHRRAVAFAVLAFVCVAAAVATGAAAVLGAKEDRAASTKAVEAARPTVKRVLESGKPFTIFRSLDRQNTANYGRLAVASLDGQGHGDTALAGPACQRVAFDAGRGLCLDVLGTEMGVSVLDPQLRTVHTLSLPGVPSRARISPDGRWGGVTAFIVGHAYAAPGQFSTAATIIDMNTGKKVANLEKDFKVTDNGHVIDDRERNFWGITFADDGDTFYATAAVHSRTWLIKGSIRSRRAHTIHENVECPSLSPDGTRIGYKKAVSHNPSTWRFTVLDLATGEETPLAETRSIDDQLAWLDDQHLLYGDKEGEDTWMINADGTGKPQLWLDGADSATITRGAVR